MRSTLFSVAGAARILTAGQGVRPLELGERRFLHPGPLRWLRAVGWAVALFFLVALAALPTIEVLGQLLPQTDAARFVANLAGALVALAVYALAVWLAEGRRPSEIALKPMLPELGVGLLIGSAMFAAVMGIMAGFDLYEIRSLGAASVWTAAGRAVQSGVVEEIMIRAILLRLVWRAFGPWIAFAVSAALFGFGHIANPNATAFAAICIALEAGIMLGAFYALTGRIWVSIGVHAAWNFTQGYLFGAAVSGGDFGPAIASSTARPGLPEWLTGGAFGPEASLPALVVCTAVGLAVMVLAWRAGQFAKRP
ncbi:MAG: type II CAAX endopeptidase family protein [Brevundimonas sp.]|uniref:CPBP family intramembrane glutamic endopeptidase n=1 Tax=Brevundimonas sp. TaxID=1871086 RepID=UPI00272502D9|nr:type II CAAX endopeptidase family protein [Brevundimonas sp.]MDO9609687.1 type II CAAX endopeptidase family protein [Brevundimonas sp.]